MLRKGLASFQNLLTSILTGNGVGAMAVAGKSLSLMSSSMFGQRVLPFSELNNYIGRNQKDN
jgi:hypothetical protein